MLKSFMAFTFLFAIFFVGITAITDTLKSDKRELLKIAGYSILCSLLTFVVLTLIVLLF